MLKKLFYTAIATGIGLLVILMLIAGAFCLALVYGAVFVFLIIFITCQKGELMKKSIVLLATVSVFFLIFSSVCFASFGPQKTQETQIIMEDEFWGRGMLEITTVSGKEKAFLTFPDGDEIEKLEILTPLKHWFTPQNRKLLNGADVIFTITTRVVDGKLTDKLKIRSFNVKIDRIINPPSPEKK
jgi:hypothetical protein